MHSRTISHRLELTFWTTVIPLLSKLKKYREKFFQSLSVISISGRGIKIKSLLVVLTIGWLAGFILGFLTGLG